MKWPFQIRVFLDQALMTRMTAMLPGGEGNNSPKKVKKKSPNNRRGSKAKSKPDTPPDRHTLHEAYYALMKAYVEDHDDKNASNGEK